MRTLPTQSRHHTGGTPVPVATPTPGRSRPVRQGYFWPGESFCSGTRKWDLRGAFTDHAFILPAILGSNGPRTL